MPVALTISAEQDRGYRLLLTHSGKPLLSGPLRPERAHALNDAEALRRAVGENCSYRLERDAEGGFRFRVVGNTGGTLATSAPHPTPQSLGQAIATLKALLPLAEVVLP